MDEGLQMSSRAQRGGVVAMAGDRVRGHVVSLRRPGQYQLQRRQLRSRRLLHLEIALHDDEEVTRRVIWGARVSSKCRITTFVDSPIDADDDVIGEIRPSLTLHVPVLPTPYLARPGDACLGPGVMDGQTIDGVRRHFGQTRHYGAPTLTRDDCQSRVGSRWRAGWEQDPGHG